MFTSLLIKNEKRRLQREEEHPSLVHGELNMINLSMAAPDIRLDKLLENTIADDAKRAWMGRQYRIHIGLR